jgi:hypothetical protein
LALAIQGKEKVDRTSVISAFVERTAAISVSLVRCRVFH